MLAVLALALATLSACSLVPGASTAGEEEVTAVREGDELVIRNRTDAPIWTFVAGRQALTTMLWAPTLDDDAIAPGADATVPLAGIPQGADEREVVVHWWHAETDDGARAAGAVHTISVPL